MSDILRSYKPSLIQPEPPVRTEPNQNELRDIADPIQTRRMIYDNVLQATRAIPPLANQRHTLELADVNYIDPEAYSLRDQKRAILTNQTLGRRMAGTWRLRDNATGNVLDERKATVGRVPFMTQRGTIIHNGLEYTVSNQLRMRPGVFTRVKDNGEIEAHANILPGEGVGHRYFLDPARSVFYMRLHQAKIPLMPLLRSMGATDKQLKEAWGQDIWSANATQDNNAYVNKLFERLLGSRSKAEGEVDRRAAIADAMRKMRVEPEVMKRTLGREYSNLDTDAIVDITKKLLGVSRGEQEVDDRDHLAFQTIMGPEDLFAERIAKDYGGLRRNLLYKASFRGNLKPVGTGALTRQLESVLLNSGLGQPIEEVNPAEILDKTTRITKMGEGGLGSLDAVPEESRGVQPSHLSFIDGVRTPESLRLGIDLYLAASLRKGKDGRVYAPFVDPKTNQTVYRSPQDAADLTIAFPGEMNRQSKRIGAMRGGRLGFYPKSEVDLVLPAFENAFSPLGQFVPMKSGIKAQRMAMGSRMSTQALGLLKPESPFVQTGVSGPADESFEERYGARMGAVRANKGGRVIAVSPDEIQVRYDDGTKDTVELYNNFVLNRKSGLSNTPLVQPGQTFTPGQLLAKSNFTDDKGTAALGVNARVGYLAFKGFDFEDAAVVSESFARDKMQSEHMYQHTLDIDDKMKTGRKDFISLFPGRFTKKELENIDDDGVIKPGTPVKYGDPLILTATQRTDAYGKVHKKGRPSYSDQSQLWDHHSPGVVTDVFKSDKGINVAVKSASQMQVGDKLCYDDKTELLTRHGWKLASDVSCSDEMASLRPDGTIEYLLPAATHAYDHDGRMYLLQTTQVDLCVTDNHFLYAKPRGAENYSLIPAERLAGRRFRLKKNGSWAGKNIRTVRLKGFDVPAGQFGRGHRRLPDLVLPAKTYAMLLGLFISEGNLVCQPETGTYGIDISQTGRQMNWLKSEMQRRGIKFTEHSNGEKLRIYSKVLWNHWKDQPKAWQKYLPSFVFDWSPSLLRTLFKWLMFGDGSYQTTSRTYFTSSHRLAGDFQHLCLLAGYAANVSVRHDEHEQEILGRVCRVRTGYAVTVYFHKFEPEINHGHARSQRGQKEGWTHYAGRVFCVTLPRNHVLYARRNGKACWCGNSFRYGDKSVVSAVVPDDQMPQDEQGRPMEVLINPLGVISRGNPSQIVEAVLGKIVEKTGKPYKIKEFEDIQDLVDFAEKEAKKHGIKDLETVIDPETGRGIKDVLVGNRFVMKLSHMAEDKLQGRSFGSYTADEVPAKGGPEGSKQVGLLQQNALLSHGVAAVQKDASTIRGQRNEDYWLAFMQGVTPPAPKVPFIYQKFVNQLRAAGVNVVEDGTQTHIMAMTDKDVDQMAGDRFVESGETVDFSKGMKPVKGGLFDPALTGGNDGNRWSAVKLVEPMPNPVMEEPIRRVLGLTQKAFENVLSGREKLPNGESGPAGIGKALASIDLDKAISKARAEIASGRKTRRDAAVRQLGYLKSAKKLNIHPKDWILSKVPVLPPKFRPVSVMSGSGLPLVADANYLYKELIEANKNLKTMQDVVEDVGDERLALYNSFQAVTGLGEPVHPKLQEKRVKGILAHVFGSSPKSGTVQRRLIGSAVDLVGRAVITPNPELDMDQVGLPEERAWSVYKPFVVRRLRRRGMKLTEALRHVTDKSPLARRELLGEMDDRPVIIDRAPVWHKFGVMAFHPRIVTGDTMQISPLVVKGFAADFDGDAMQYHVPASEDAVKEALEKMLPSRNLLSPADFKSPVYTPSQEYTGGLYYGSTAKRDRPVRTFRNIQDAVAAFRRGDLDAADRVKILA